MILSVFFLIAAVWKNVVLVANDEAGINLMMKNMTFFYFFFEFVHGLDAF